MQVSAGVDAFLIASLRSREKRLLGRAAVVPAILRSLARYSFPPFEVRTEAGTLPATLAVASNIRRYGGPFELTPRARADGNGLELFVFSGRGKTAAVRFALSLLVGRHLGLERSSVTSIRTATFDARANVPFQVDGDVLETETGRPLEVSLASETLRFLAPVPHRPDKHRR
jgi:diacylglycerol kinase family enzyme